MDIHCVICSVLSPEQTTSTLWNAGIHVHVVDDTLHKFVIRSNQNRIYIYVCTFTPLMQSFIPCIHYHTYACGVLYDAASKISQQRCQAWVRTLMDRPTPPNVSLISGTMSETMLPTFHSVRTWLNRVVTSAL